MAIAYQSSVCAVRKSLLRLISVKQLVLKNHAVTCTTEHEGFDAVCLNVGFYKLAFSVTVITMAPVMLEIFLHMSKSPQERV